MCFSVYTLGRAQFHGCPSPASSSGKVRLNVRVWLALLTQTLWVYDQFWKLEHVGSNPVA